MSSSMPSTLVKVWWFSLCFNFQRVDTSTEEVQGVSHHLVHPFAAAVTTVGAIVHHIETDAGHHKTQQGTQAQ
jgi:hypothetical protein